MKRVPSLMVKKKTSIINISKVPKGVFLALGDHFDQGKDFVVKRRMKINSKGIFVDSIFLIVNEEVIKS